MAENPRYRLQRSDEVAPMSEGGPEPQDDPLAELARLIGQEEAFVAAGRAGARARRTNRAEQETTAPEWLTRSDPQAAAGSGQEFAEARYRPGEGRTARSGTPESDARGVPGDPRHYGSHEEDAGYSRGRGGSGYDDRAQIDEGDPYAVAALDGRYDHPPEEEGDDAEMAAHRGGEAAYEDEIPYGEEAYGNPSRLPGRPGLRAIAIILVLIAMGSAAVAFGYRAWTGGPGSAGPAPIIKADTGPNKVVPAPGTDSQQNKQIYDRIGEKLQSSADRLVSREEQPIEPGDLARQAEPRVVYPAPGTVMIGSQALGSAPPAASQAGSSGPPEAKKVHTITIRPDQPLTAIEPADPTATGSTSPGVPPPVPPQNTVPPGQKSAAAAPATTRSATPARAAPRATSGSGPLAINSQGQDAEAEGTTGSRASAAPKSAATAPYRTAALPSGSETGHYVVQLSSQKSESDAQASFRALQAKYPDVLGDQRSLVRRADLGSKGVFYRAQVGPFATADEANRLCSDLKSAGGQCIVQRN